MTVIDLGLSCLALGVLARIAWTDFRTLRIPNRDVLVLTACVLPLLIPGVTPEGWSNIVPALLLFVLGVIFWLFRMMGAGDAKLFFPLGVLIGWQGVAVFAICLMPLSLVFLALAKLASRGLLGQGAFAARLAEIGRGRGIPYGVPMALAAAVGVVWRLAV